MDRLPVREIEDTDVSSQMDPEDINEDGSDSDSDSDFSNASDHKNF